MKNLSIFTAILVAIVPGIASAASSTALSNITTVDSRDAYLIIDLKPELADSTKEDGRRFVSFQTQKETFDPSSKSFSLKVPAFNKAGGGWGAKQAGLGAYYGLEIMASGLTEGDRLQYKSPSGVWKTARFNTVIDITVSEGTYYFRVDNVSGLLPTPLTIYARFKSARFCHHVPRPVRSLDKTKPLWLLIHGKNDGENSFRSMNSALRSAGLGAQIVSVDWSAGADGAGSLIPSKLESANGRHFFNLAKNLASVLKEIGFKPEEGQVNIAGHSWGTLVGYETALSFGGVKRFIALDPAILAGGGYDDGRVNFKDVSLTSTGVKGGFGEKVLGSEKKAKTCDFAIRVISETHTGDSRGTLFYHSLPRNWFTNAARKSTSDAYWPYFHNLVFREDETPSIPWADFAAKGMSKFDLECHGYTYCENNKEPKPSVSKFNLHQYVLYKNLSDAEVEATRVLKNGKVVWAVKERVK